MKIQKLLIAQTQKAIQAKYQVDLKTVEIQETRKEFEGDLTIVIFPMLKLLKSNPASIATEIGEYLKNNLEAVLAYNVIKGFLNLVLSDAYYISRFLAICHQPNYGKVAPNEDQKAILVEYASPNTNKPLHLGHVRNILLGHAVSEILKASGKKVHKTQIINDRGIHICKSMVAWQKFGNQETPASTRTKGDKFVGKYYVAFDKAYREEIEMRKQQGLDEADAKNNVPIQLEAQAMLQKWEANDPKVYALWKTMNQWVYDGFDQTYRAIGVDFDSYYYESDTYLLGKDYIKKGLNQGVFFQKEDGSIWCDLTESGLDEKLILRSDGTAVYITQDIGTAIQRVIDHQQIGGMIYTVGNEQDYHFKVLFLILQKLGLDWAANLHHLSYGMVDLPNGKMKSREGTVVDADDLIDEMKNQAEIISKDLGKLQGYSDFQKQQVYKMVGLGALKYFILKVDPRKKILFDPEASVDFQGNTGPFIQYTYARIQSILRKADFEDDKHWDLKVLHPKEKELIKLLENYPQVIQQAAEELSPAWIANYTYDLVKSYNSFFQNVPIFGAQTDAEVRFRVQLSKMTGLVIQSAFGLLGIQVPERM